MPEKEKPPAKPVDIYLRVETRINMADTNKNINENYIEEIKKAVKEIKYGSLTLIIQDGKVIQIDKTEKVRL